MANWKHIEMTIDELKELVRGVYDRKYFTSLQCDGYMVTMVFMPVLFFGAKPSKPAFPTPDKDIRKDRKNKLEHFNELEQWKKDVQEWEDDTQIREEYFKNIGMIYEEFSKAGPRGINGYPTFVSCKIVSIEDTKKFIEMYKKYEKVREDFENEWGVEKVDA